MAQALGSAQPGVKGAVKGGSEMEERIESKEELATCRHCADRRQESDCT